MSITISPALGVLPCRTSVPKSSPFSAQSKRDISWHDEVVLAAVCPEGGSLGGSPVGCSHSPRGDEPCGCVGGSGLRLGSGGTGGAGG